MGTPGGVDVAGAAFGVAEFPNFVVRRSLDSAHKIKQTNKHTRTRSRIGVCYTMGEVCMFMCRCMCAAALWLRLSKEHSRTAHPHSTAALNTAALNTAALTTAAQHSRT